MALTTKQRANLEKLASYLEGLPAGYRHFEMAYYTGLSASDPKIIQYALENGGVDACGTVACAAGHGPAAGILATPDMITKDWRGNACVNWRQYVEFFTPRASDEFDWCFGSIWDMYDNSHYGAAARIRYLLDRGVPGEIRSASVPLYAPYRIDRKAKADA